MAVKVDSNKQKDVSAQPAFDPASAASVPGATSVLDILSRISAPTLMGEDANKYFEGIISTLKNKPKITFSSVPITTDKVEARVIYSDRTKFGIMLVFGETYNLPPSNVPVTESFPELAQKLAGFAPDVRLIQSITINSVDYSLRTQMADFIYNVIYGMDYPQDVSVRLETLKNSSRFAVSTNIATVRNEMKRLSPHAVPTRDDIGCVVYLVIPKNPSQPFQRMTADDYDYRPVLVMTGYTNIMNMTTQSFGVGIGTGVQETKFMPIVSITSIMSAIPSRTILGMAIPIAAESFITQNGWLRPYMTLGNDEANLGNLCQDRETGKIWKVSKQEELSTLLQTCFCTPFLSLDVTEGRARIPGIDDFVSNHEAAFATIGTVINDPNIPLNPSPIKATWQEFVGTVTLPGGKLVDSRSLDYLKLIKDIGDFGRLQPLLNQPNRPETRINQQREFCPDIHPDYTNYRVVLDSSFVIYIASKLAGAIKIDFDGTVINNDINMNSMLASGGNQYGQLFSANAGSTGWSTNGFHAMRY